MTTGFKRKSVFALIVTLLLSLVMFVGVTIGEAKAQESENANVTIDVADAFETVQGASVRTIADENGNYGIRFEIRMLSSEYEKFMNSSVYSDIQFGVTIIPEDYKEKYGDFTEENLFGENKKYDLFDGIADSNNVANVICMTNGTLLKDTVVVEDENDPENTTKNYKSLYAAITTINEKNFTRPFVGVGFVSYKVNGEQKYVVEESLSRSAAYVAQVEIESERYAEYDEVVQGALNDYLENPPVKLSATKGGADYDVSDIKAALADYKSGETLDISAIAAKNAPYGYAVAENSVLSAEIPYSGVASFAVNYDTWANVGTTGNLALSIAENGKVSVTGTDAASVEQKDKYTLYTVKVNGDQKLKFDADFIQDIKDAGLNSIKFTFELTRGSGSTIKDTNVSIYLSVYNGASWANKTIYATNTVNAVATFPQTYQWGISDILDNLAEGGTIGLRMAAGSNEPLNMKITHLEFVKQTEDDYAQYLGKNIVTSVLSDGIASWYNQKTARLYTDDDSIMMGAYGADSRAYLRFDPMFIKYAYEQGYTKFNIKFTTSTTLSKRGSTFQCGLYPYSSSTGKQGTRYSETAKTWIADVTPTDYDLTYTISSTMYNKANLETGDTILFGSAAATAISEGVVTFDITHISFTKPAA